MRGWVLLRVSLNCSDVVNLTVLKFDEGGVGCGGASKLYLFLLTVAPLTQNFLVVARITAMLCSLWGE
jgi:hypothetical protein